MIDVEIKELRCFAHVADTLNFNRAAQQLNISQPVVTKTVAQLEHKLGVKLFERTTRRVALTAAGVLLRKEVDGLLAHFDRVQRDVRHAIGMDSGRFCIGVTPSAMLESFSHVVKGIGEHHPEIELEIRELPTDVQLKALLSAELDMGFVLNLAQISRNEFSVQPIHEEVMRLAVPINHSHLRQLKNTSIPLSAFANETFIVPARTRNPGVHDEIIRACAISGFKPKIKDCHESQSCLSLVQAGIGVSFITEAMNCDQRSGVEVITLAEPAPVLSIAVVWRKGDPSPLLKTITDLL